MTTVLSPSLAVSLSIAGSGLLVGSKFSLANGPG